ncbi:MAG: LysM peptidoglycan-binding domain-containing protein [Endomicrobiales bacterium]|nr:LysM peptidoglycan-binding domain-containing protein [Endomicrobiales bacterium]
MRITKLHLILIFVVIAIGGIYAYQSHLETKRQAEIEAQRQAEALRLEQEERKKADYQKYKKLATQAIAVAGEYWLSAKREGRNVSKGQETLRQAKSAFAQEDFKTAHALARQSIDALKISKQEKLYYKVVRGDNLWNIAKMPRHYGRGAMWVKIWRANEKQIPDFDIIRPSQVLYIPKKGDTALAKTETR